MQLGPAHSPILEVGIVPDFILGMHPSTCCNQVHPHVHACIDVPNYDIACMVYLALEFSIWLGYDECQHSSFSDIIDIICINVNRICNTVLSLEGFENGRLLITITSYALLMWVSVKVSASRLLVCPTVDGLICVSLKIDKGWM